MVRNERVKIMPSDITVGRQVLDIVTSGMYNNPLMVVREYIQNAVDSIDEAIEKHMLRQGEGTVKIELDGHERTLSIEDNGIGVSNEDVKTILYGLGYSEKENGKRRGFRGIGRLGGMGYCERVVFETRRFDYETVAIVKWDCHLLRNLVACSGKKNSAEEVIRNAVSLRFRNPTSTDPKHFFRVSMCDIHRFHKDELMNIGALRMYLGQVAPVAFDRSAFLFADEIENYLENVKGYECYEIKLNGHKILRPHTDIFPISSNQVDRIEGVELFDIRGRVGLQIGKGWYAKTHYLASIPTHVGMRGIRIRQGNIEIGNEYALEDAFTERRFSTWHIGEIHFDYSLKANARRDGFEQTEDYEAFLEQARILGKHLSHLCRLSSKNRSDALNAEVWMDQIESIMGKPFFIDEEHYHQNKAIAQRNLKRLEILQKNGELRTGLKRRFLHAKEFFGNGNDRPSYLSTVLDERKLRQIEKKQLVELLAKALVTGKEGTALENTLFGAMSPYLKPKVSKLYKGK